MPYYVYMIQCDDGSFYTGYSKNLDRRMRQLMKGKGARYLRIHRPKKLVHVEEYDSRAEAMRRERRVKLLSHSRKTGLARSGMRAKHGVKKMRAYRTEK